MLLADDRPAAKAIKRFWKKGTTKGQIKYHFDILVTAETSGISRDILASAVAKWEIDEWAVCISLTQRCVVLIIKSGLEAKPSSP